MMDQTQAMKVLLTGTARGLDLLKRMPKRFTARGWDLDDRCHIAIAAVCCVKIRCPKTKFTVPVGTDDPPCWKAITKEHVSAQEIVTALELDDMLETELIRV